MHPMPEQLAQERCTPRADKGQDAQNPALGTALPGHAAIPILRHGTHSAPSSRKPDFPMNFHHLSLTRKLTIAFSILVAIIIGVSTLSVVSLSESQHDFDSFVSDEFNRGGAGP